MAYDGVSVMYLSLRSEKTDSAKKQSGFSLIELLVVVVIVGVIALIGTPQLLGMRAKSSVRADARDVHSTYRQAQTEAVKRSENACVKIYAGSSTYQIQLMDYFGTIFLGKSTDLPIKKLRPGTTISTPTADPCFNPRGLPISGDGTITLTNSTSSLIMEVTLKKSGHVTSTNQ